MNELNSRKGIEMGRADFAYKKVLEAKAELGKGGDIKYKAYVKKIPMMIKTNGLGATFAFVKAKRKEKAYEIIYGQTAKWLNEDPKGLIQLKTGDDLVAVLISLPSPEYRAATAEIMALFSWLRRFAEGLIEGESNE